jgi:hypothetical protein
MSLPSTIRLAFSVFTKEIEMRAVIFSECKQRKGGKKIHGKLSNLYGENSYTLGAVKY